MKIKGLLVALGAFVAVSAAAGQASASYTCSTGYRPWSSSLGTEGNIFFSLYTGPDCTGTFEGNFYLCSAGATSSVCSSSSSYRYDRQGLLAMFRSFVDAVNNNTYTYTATSSCIGVSSGCATYATFYGD